MCAVKSKRGPKLSKRLARFSRKAGKTGSEHIRENLIERVSHIQNVRLLILEWALLVSAIILLAITQILLYHESYATVSYTSGGTYTEATLGKVSTLNPLFASNNSERTLSRLMFATLTTTDYSGHTGLGLAQSLKPTDSGKVWHLKLKSGLVWSDGQPITNADVLNTIRLIQSPSLNTLYTSNLTGVKVTEGEDGEIIFTLPAAYANFADSLNIPVLPAHILGDVAPSQLLSHKFSSEPVTSGPFNFTSLQTDSAAVSSLTTVYLSSNPNYYAGDPLINTFVVKAYANTNDILEALGTGLITGTAALTARDADKITLPDVYEKRTTLNNGVFAFINTSSEILKNQKLRQAIQQGISLDALREHLNGEQPLDYPILSSQIKLNNYPALPERDLEAAKATVASADFDHNTPLQIATISTGYFPDLAREFATQLEALGFKTDVAIYEPDQDFLLNVVRPRSYDILIYEAELGVSPDLLAYYHSSQATPSGLNLSNYRNSIASDLILAARSTTNPKTAATKYETFLTNWVADVPAIGICQTNMSYFYNKNTRNFDQDNRLVAPTDRFSDIQNWSVVQTSANRTP